MASPLAAQLGKLLQVRALRAPLLAARSQAVQLIPRRWLNLQEYQSKKLMSDNGVKVQRFFVANTAKEALEAAKRLNAKEIQCEAKGKPPPSFSWTRNGTHFDIDKDPLVTMNPGSGTLIINIMSEGKAESYEGVYQCTARNERGAAISNNIIIRPSRSPLWTKEKLEPIILRNGHSLVLPCRPPIGLPPPIIFWMDNSFQRLPQSERVSQGLNGDLYFSNVLPEDTREDYICYARFNHTQTIQQKQPISVKVISAKSNKERPPTFLTPEGNTSNKEELRGNVLSLECIAEGLPTPVIYWIKEDGTLPVNRTFYRNFKKTLQISHVSEADSGNYQCIAQNALGVIHHTISVTIKAAPYWIMAPQNLVLSPGEDGALICRANGNPKTQN